MKYATRIIALIMFTCLCLAIGSDERISAATGGTENNNGVKFIVFAKEEANNPDSVVVNAKTRYARGNNPPTRPYNLSGNPYYYYIVGMHNYVFTDYYFKADSNGCISISVNLNSGGDTIRITICKRTFWGYSTESSWSGDPQSIQGIGFYDLTTTDDYFFLFETLSSSTEVNGYGYIHFPGDIIP